MTYKEALEWCVMFEDNIVFNGKGGKRESLALSAMKECRKALKKQIPKKPNVGVQHFLKCACCDSVIRKTEKFCHECGQALDWSDAE